MMSNHQNVTDGLRILTGVLAPYIAGELRSRFGDDWWDKGVLGVLFDTQKRGLPSHGDEDHLMRSLDAARCLLLIDVQWNDWFRSKLSREHRTWIKELRDTRNKWAHSGLVDTADDDAWRALDTMTRLVEQMDAEATERLRTLARKVRYGTAGPSTSAETIGSGVLSAVPRQGLLPWREVAKPHPDVAAGRYQMAEFAADLSQVVRGTAESEYQDPVEFFARTYLTEGMRGLLRQALKRILGTGGEPVIQLQTVFGGGKTHSLLALYHLLHGGVSPQRLPSIAPLLAEVGIERIPQVRVAVVVGTALNPTRERRPPNMRMVIRTLWGEIGAQLAEQAGNPKLYDHVRNADRKGVPPGSEALRALFDACGPCLILIDELVAYAKKIYGVDGLPAGSFDAVHTFVQELSEAVAASKNTVLVATIPESEIEAGGDVGNDTLNRIRHIFGRYDATWTPVSSEEGFEVVRRRLFLSIDDTRARDDVCSAFGSLYRDGHGDFPPECGEARYLERLTACYPIHPEVFERLYADWATLERFQRTRGVLRLMATVIHDLWERNDAGLLILPGSLGLDAVAVRGELTRYLPEGWTAVLDSDVDGRNSGPQRVDAENPRFGQSVAGRRVARAVFLGSAPHVAQQQVRGVEDVRVRLATVQPGEQVAVFKDALSQLSERLTYLYRMDRRYWYDTRPNLRRTVEDRAGQIAEHEVEREIERRVRAASQRKDRGDFRGVHVCPAASDDVPDAREIRLVVLRPSDVHKRGSDDSPALAAAADILKHRGNALRQHCNTLVFLAADGEAMDGLKQEARRFLAWQSVDRDKEELNLDANQRREASERTKAADGNVGIRFREAWRWLLAPDQSSDDGKLGPLEWEATRLAGDDESVVARASRHLRSEQQLVVRLSPALLRMELDRWFWTGASHVPAKKVWDALCAYCYLPRLADERVFANAIREGVASRDYFGYATSVGADGRYEGLAFGRSAEAVHVDDASVLVKPEDCAEQVAAEMQHATDAQRGAGVPEGTVEYISTDPDKPPTPPEAPALWRRFFGTIKIDPDRAGRDMGNVADEVLIHMTTLPGVKVTVTVEIAADFPDGADADVRRTVGENCDALGFKPYGFEES